MDPPIDELVDFLRNHTPPRENFMSIPDATNTHDGGNGNNGSLRSRFGSLRRRSKPAPPNTLPNQIRLPDSAVAGTTIGGHRHIAISIPIEYLPFGPTPRCQYPVYQHEPPQLSSWPPHRDVDTVLRFTDNKGVITVLRTVSEDRESPSSTNPSAPKTMLHRSLPAPTVGHPMTTQLPISPPQSPQVFPSQSTNFKDYFGGRTPNSPPNHHHLNLEPRNELDKNPRRDESPVIPPWGARHSPRLHYPIPGPSNAFTGSASGHLDTIDGVMHGEGHCNKFPVGPQAVGQSSLPVRSVSSGNCVATHGVWTTNPIKPETRTETMPVGKVGGDGTNVGGRQQSRLVNSSSSDDISLRVITRNPLESPPTSANTMGADIKSRKERVREKRRRDVEASRAPRDRQSGDPADVRDESSSVSSQSRRRWSMPSHARSSIRTEPSGQNAMTPMVVVMDVRPSTPPATNHRDPRSPASTNMARNYNSTSSPSSRGLYTTSTGPTPPESPWSGPSYAQALPLDRTSLSRRREMQARRGSAKGVNEGVSETIPGAPVSKREAHRGYESLRDFRIHEIERRMRRIERNGDTWLKALVPVLGDLNQTLVKMQDDGRGPMSGLSPVTPGKRGRSSRPARLSRGPGSTLRDEVLVLGHLERNIMADDGEGSTSGLDTIEPLMRELQGASRLSLESVCRGMGTDKYEDDRTMVGGF